MIRETRNNRSIRIERMAEALRTSAASLSRYERGRRPWPPELYSRALAYLGLEADQPQAYWSWAQHRKYWDSYHVETDPGTTWADQPEGYPEFYRVLNPTRTPPLDFRRRVRTDSLLEPCIYISWCEAGADCVYVSLAAMSFPYHPLVDENCKPMSMARRAAFVIDGWIIWPQVNVLVKGKKIRLDCLGYNGTRWAGFEWNGPLHGQNPEQKKWDEKRDLSLGFEIFRFSQAEILSGHIVDLIRQKLKGPSADR